MNSNVRKHLDTLHHYLILLRVYSGYQSKQNIFYLFNEVLRKLV